MKKLTSMLIFMISLAFMVTSCSNQNDVMNPDLQDPPAPIDPGGSDDPPPDGEGCITIQDEILEYSAGHYLEGELLETGYDDYGYNYQAHIFNGYYANAYLGRDGFPPYKGDDDEYLEENPEAENSWVWPYRNTKLKMKWSDTWLSNKDCNRDFKLDRGYACDSDDASSSACPGAWLTNHMSGKDNGKKWTYFVKIVAVRETDYKEDGTWYDENGKEIGPEIWGSFAIIQEQESGNVSKYKSPSGPGFGKYKK